MENGKQVNEPKDIKEIAEYSRGQLSKLPVEFERFENPHIYKIGLSKSLKEERDRLVKHFKRNF